MAKSGTIAKRTGLGAGLAAAVGLGATWAMPDADDHCLRIGLGDLFCPTGTVTVFGDEPGIVFDALDEQNPPDLGNERTRRELLRAAAGHLDLDDPSAHRLRLYPDIGQDGRFVLAGLLPGELTVFPPYGGDNGLVDEDPEQFFGGLGVAYTTLLAASRLGAKGRKPEKKFDPELERRAERLDSGLKKKREWEELKKAPSLEGYRSPQPRRSTRGGFGRGHIIGGTREDDAQYSDPHEVSEIVEEGRQRTRAAERKAENADAQEEYDERMAGIQYEGEDAIDRSKKRKAELIESLNEARVGVTDTTRSELARQLDHDGIPNSYLNPTDVPPFIGKRRSKER